jgi:hypothetical protein
MSSRDYIRSVVSANTSLNGQRLGDEVYNPTSNRLFKTLPVGGTQVTNVEVLLNGPALASSNISVNNLTVGGDLPVGGNITVGPTTFNKNGTITNYGITSNVLGSVSGSTTIDLTRGNYVFATATGIITWTFSNAVSSPNACGFILELVNGGSFTQNWPVGTRWPSGFAPALTASGTDILTFLTDDGGVNWRGVVSMSDSR